MLEKTIYFFVFLVQSFNEDALNQLQTKQQQNKGKILR